MRIILALFLFGMAPPVMAQGVDELEPLQQEFVTGNVLSTLYHEVGHGLIDVLNLPVLGREEDAADALAIVLTHEVWLEDEARSVATATALSFLMAADEGGEIAYWDVHGTDQQRFYNTVCLFYGADPEGRADFAQGFELPEGRADQCPEEFTMAEQSWGAFLAEIDLPEGAPPSESFSFAGGSEDDPIAVLLATEVEDLNARYQLPVPLTISLEPCDQVNAFYNPSDKSITICTEYVDYLAQQAQAADL